ncbi:MAG TPA: response regulator transcription factor [Bacteroidota bacterium]|nr:response regulator transcription factor [Bacteroidota bacterium]
MQTILVVDDDRDIVDLVKYNLRKEGYNVLIARNGAAALEQANQMPDLVILDVMMPEVNGWEVVKRLKSGVKTSAIPIIFLTAKGSEVDEVLGLELGADDYLVKPISIPKLLARVRSIFRKRDPGRAEREHIVVGAIEILPDQHLIRIDGREIFFPKKEFDVLLYLAEREGRAVSRETLLNAVWGSDTLVVDRTVDVHIAKIRDKLGKHAGYVETIKGVGYRLRSQ